MNRKLWLSLTMCVGWLLFATGGAGAPAQVAAAASHGGQAAPPSGSGAAPAAEAPPAAPQEPADTPYTLVASGVTSYTISDPKVFYYDLPPCSYPPPPAPAAPTVNLYETIQRIPTYGGIPRKLFSHQVNSLCPSGQDVLSNIVSDGSYVYWISSVEKGLVKLSVNANVGDTPTVVNTTYGGQGQIVLAQGALFALTGGNSILYEINLSTGTSTLLADAGTGSIDFQTEGTYLYWINGGTLHQWDIAAAKEKSTIASGVTGFYPANASLYYGKGKQLYQFDKTARTSDLIYTSSNSTARIYSLRYDGTHLFWFEDHTLPLCGGCFLHEHDDVLFRSGPGGGNPTQIYIFHAGAFSPQPQASDLKGAGSYLFWLENGALQKLPKDAAALPKINLVADTLEVTQGIQNTSNTVLLIQGRDTYVRFYVHSAGAAVPGVGAFLYRTNSGGTVIDGPLDGGLLTVLPSPHRNNLNDSFLFELPWNWLDGSTLYLKAELNPNQDPLEPNYGDNGSGVYGFTLEPSPRLAMDLIEWGYRLGGKLYYPTTTDEQLLESWFRRAYPLASAPGSLSDPTPGFRPGAWQLYDSGLGSRVNQTAPECTGSLCASIYTNNAMQAMRVELSLPDNLYLHGLISNRAGFFPRGIACCGTHVSSSPAYCCAGWDSDGSSADFYAGHETGHNLGRSHPSSSAASCGNSASDPSYPYPLGHIGPNNGSLEGFDVGDGSFGINLTIYPGNQWTDVMTYCSNEWISDYTYNAMYAYMIANPYPAPNPGSQSLGAPALAGNWLAVYGEIVTSANAALQARVPTFRAAANSAILTRVRRLSTIAALPPLVAGPDYSIQLFDAGNSLLASYPFTPQPATSDAPGSLPFTQVVTDVANTAQVRIVRLSDSAVLATQAISPHSPVVSNVHLVGAPNPVNGTVTLDWTATDADGDPLAFDIYYSRDAGATLQPLQLGVSGSTTDIDTAALGGSGTALLRVVANDGVNTAQADSAVFTMANKPPRPMILAPGDGTHRHWGQLVNFSGQALDAQDGGVDPSQLVWRDQNGVLGTGALLSISDLPVGTDVITLTATDSLNQKASTSITVIVDDNLSLPGPTLSVGPQQFGWSFTSNASPTQTDVLTLDNVGGGTLNWTATTDAPWLTLSLASGTAPSQITLTADPSGLANNTTQRRHVFINVPAGGGSPAQQLTIPVGIDVGVSQDNPPPAPLLVFLPLVAR